ncbi:relaxin-3 receptor 1 [Camelus ferus]|nr:relaxin-3 receptor 1 [Camelus ferus]
MNKAAGGDELAELFSLIPNLVQAANTSGNESQLQDLWWELGLELPDGAAPELEGADTEARVRILISVVYWVVCALGLTGNLLVLYLMKIENALDFKWPFGKAMCKIVSISHRTRGHGRGECCGRSLGDSRCFSARALCLLIWALAALASLPNAIFSTTIKVMGEELCLKVLLGFVLPLGIISLCYLLLVRFISDHRMARTEGGASAAGGGLAEASARRRSKVTKSVTIVVLSFFLCWLPNQALTTWSILIKFNAVPFSQEYFLCQVYAFPVSVCLAHSNSCLNPILYCLVRREFRKALKNLLWRIASPSLTSMRPFTATTKPEPEDQGLQALAPLHQAAEPDLLYYPPAAGRGSLQRGALRRAAQQLRLLKQAEAQGCVKEGPKTHPKSMVPLLRAATPNELTPQGLPRY